MGDRPPLPSSTSTSTSIQRIVPPTHQDASNISLSTFQSSSFDVSKFVQSLMQQDVQLAKQTGGGKSHLIPLTLFFECGAHSHSFSNSN